MTAKTTRPLCVLSDANVIIKCHELGIWEGMLAVDQDCCFSMRGAGLWPVATGFVFHL